MYKVVGTYNSMYAISDEETGELDMFTEWEIRLLLTCMCQLQDSNGNPMKLNADGTLEGYVTDMSSAMNDSSDEDDTSEDDVEYDEYDEYEEVDDEDEYEEDDEEYEEDDDDYEEEDDEYSSTVTKLYSYLTPEQIEILRKYYLWYSQRIFTDAQKDPTLGMKNQAALQRKKGNLQVLRNTGGLWHYAGFLDLGYKGAGYCTLGHPLRYMHLAWDVTYSDIDTAFFGESYDNKYEDVIESDHCIKFGIKCISDFFEVSSECVSAMQKAQRETLKDMALLYEYYSNNQQDEVNKTFDRIDEIFRPVLKRVLRAKMFGAKESDYSFSIPLLHFMMQFRDAHLVPPKSLIQEFRDKFIGWDSHKFYGTLSSPRRSVFFKNLALLYNDKESLELLEKDLQYQFHVMDYFRVMYTYEICGWYKYNADTNKDEGGTSRVVKSELMNLYRQIEVIFGRPLYTFDESVKVLKFFGLVAKHDNGVYKFKYPLVDTSGEMWKVIDEPDSVPAKVVSKEILGYQDEAFKEAFKGVLFLGSWSDDYRLQREIKNMLSDNGLEETINTLMKRAEVVDLGKEAFERYLFDNAKSKVDVHNAEVLAEQARLQEEERRREEAAKEAPKKAEDMEDSEIVEYLRGVDMSADPRLSFASQVLDTLKTQRFPPTARQMKFLIQAYNRVTGQEAEKLQLSDRQDLAKAIDWAVTQRPRELQPKTIQICESIKKYGSISERQLKYAEDALELFNKQGGN